MQEKQNDIPHIDTFVGIPREYAHVRPGWEEIIAKELEKGGKFEKGELEKTKRDLELISFAQDAVLEDMAKYGREKDLKIELDHIHILEEGGTEKVTKGQLGKGAHSTLSGCILVDRTKSDIDFILSLFHELSHMKAYQVVQVMPGNEEKNASLEQYRSGFSVMSRNGKVNYFADFEEAVVGLLTQRFFEEKVKKSPLLVDEVETLEEWQYTTDTSRLDELESLNKLINYLWEKNRDQYKSREEIVDIFIDAHANGRLFPVARLVEKTFGKGSFRALGKGTSEEIEKEGVVKNQTELPLKS